MVAKLTYPVPFADLQQKAQQRRALADKLTELGLQNNQGYRSWAQVLGQLADAWAGHSISKDADNLETDYNTKLGNSFSTAHQQFQTDVAAGMTPEQLQAKYGTNPFEQDELKPYVEAIGARLKARGEQGEKLEKAPDGSYKPATSMSGPQFDPQATVIPDGKGGWQLNPLKITANRLSQANGPTINATTSMQSPMGQPQASPAPSPNSGMDLSLLKPDERQILAQELARRAGGSQVGGPATVLNNTHIPMGSPLSAAKAPDGVTLDGRPYWNVNGVPYDNPEGK